MVRKRCMRSLFCLYLCLTSLTGSGAPSSFTYLLQADARHKTPHNAVTALRETDRDWIILDPVFKTEGQQRWTESNLASLRRGHPQRRVLAYLSIGEAENYRPYWQNGWKQRPPAWLGKENPDWKGNFKVAYWNPEWQRLLLREVDRILTVGFDGLYLDIVDAFEYYERDGDKFIDHRKNPATGNTFREDMIRWVKKVALRARGSRPDLLIIPQNGAQLLANKEYREAISGIGIEDLFTNGRKTQSRDHTDYLLGFLTRLKPDEKPILVVDYSKKKVLTQSARDKARQHGFVFLNTDRALKSLGTH
jgi:cysteinyl-tRNA synthetase